jgi:cell division protein ZapE
MQLIEYYQQQCQNGSIQPDPEQLVALDLFQSVSENLQRNRKSSGLLRLRKPKHVKGLYVWGSVGIGKTLLMDCFFHCLPFEEKLRLHFHAFMQLVHRELKKYQGKSDPLQTIARDFAKKFCKKI